MTRNSQASVPHGWERAKSESLAAELRSFGLELGDLLLQLLDLARLVVLLLRSGQTLLEQEHLLPDHFEPLLHFAVH